MNREHPLVESAQEMPEKQKARLPSPPGAHNRGHMGWTIPCIGQVLCVGGVYSIPPIIVQEISDSGGTSQDQSPVHQGGLHHLHI